MVTINHIDPLQHATVWWLGVKFKTSRGELSKLQRLAHLGITEATEVTPTPTTEVPLRFPPLYLELEAEAQAEVYRLCCSEEAQI
jgi:hypothetical protein